MIKTIIISISIVLFAGLAVSVVMNNEDKKQLVKEYNKKFIDTPAYYKKYVRESIVYKSKH